MNKVSRELVKITREIKALDEEGDGSGFQVLHDMKNYNMENDLANKESEYKKYTGTGNRMETISI